VRPVGGILTACLLMAVGGGVRAIVYAVPTRFHAPSVAGRLYIVGLLGFALAYGGLLTGLASRRSLSLASVAFLSYATCTLYTLLWSLVQVVGHGDGPASPVCGAAGKILLDQVNIAPVSLCVAYFLAATCQGRSHLRRLLAQAATDLHLDVRPIVFLCAWPLGALGAYLLWQFVDLRSAQTFAREDGVVGWLAAAAFLGGGLRAAVAARRLRRVRRLALEPSCLVLAPGGIFVAGEEASWRSWVLPFGQELRKSNTQGEGSFHNLRSVQAVVPACLGYAASLAALLLGGLARLALRPHPPARLPAVY